MKPGVEAPPPGVSAFAFYKSQQNNKKKKIKKTKKTTTAVVKSLRSSKGRKAKLLDVRGNIELLLSPETKLMRSGRHRKAAKLEAGRARMSESGTTTKDSPKGDGSKKKNKRRRGLPKSGGLPPPAEKGYEARILLGGGQSPAGGRGDIPTTPPAGRGQPPPYYDSVEEGRKLLAWLLEPEPLDDFLSECWLREPKLVRRGRPDWYAHLRLSSASLDAMLRSNHLRYSRNVDVTSYEDGVRQTHNEEGRALPAQVWDYYDNGCSVRWLDPQAYNSRLWLLNSTLQEFFGGMVGANVYLTPPNSQGFAPHFDDIEAFVLQLEGRKHWRLYRPSAKDVNPRHSSGNFKPDEVGEPFMEVTLEAGDLLYFPRGTVHQATASDSHSLHVTISCNQHNTWADLLEQVVPAALSRAISEDPDFRECLPLGHQDYVGSNCREAGGGRRAAFTDKVKNLVTRMLDYLPIDEGVDQMGKSFMAEALPPCLLSEEVQCSVYGSKMRILAGGKVAGATALQMMDENTKVKLVRRHCIRLVYEPTGPRVYFSSDNTCESREVEQEGLELTPDLVPGVAMLIYAYPKYLRVAELPIADLDAKIAFTFNLWEKGLLLTKRPLTDPA